MDPNGQPPAAVQRRYEGQVPPMEPLGSNSTISGLARLIHLRLGLVDPPGPTDRVPLQGRTPAADTAYADQ